MKNLFFGIVVFTCLSCSQGHDSLTILNLTDKDLIFDYNRYYKDEREINYVEYYVNRLDKKKVEKTQTISRLNDAFVDMSFATFISKTPKKYLELFVFNLDTMLKYREGYKINYLINKKLYYKKINLTTDTLEKLNWTITIK